MTSSRSRSTANTSSRRCAARSRRASTADVSRIAAGKLTLDRRPVDLKAIIEAALDAIRGPAEARGVQLETRLEVAHAQADADPARLQQILWNLLSNAVKFSAEGGRVVVR